MWAFASRRSASAAAPGGSSRSITATGRSSYTLSPMCSASRRAAATFSTARWTIAMPCDSKQQMPSMFTPALPMASQTLARAPGRFSTIRVRLVVIVPGRRLRGGCFAPLHEELQKFVSLTQAPGSLIAIMHHVLDDPQDRGRPHIEAAVELLHPLEDLLSRQVRIFDGCVLDSVLVHQSVLLEPAILESPRIELGAGIGCCE